MYKDLVYFVVSSPVTGQEEDVLFTCLLGRPRSYGADAAPSFVGDRRTLGLIEKPVELAPAMLGGVKTGKPLKGFFEFERKRE